MAVVVLNFSVYYFSRVIAGGAYHHSLGWEFENYIPLLPWTVIIYFGCYLFWIANYILCTRFDSAQAKRFLWADMMGKVVCFLCYVLYPTTMVRPEITGSGIFNEGMRFLYAVDAADNLFPSIHCFVSWMCYIGMRKDDRYPRSYRVFSLLFASAVCISTLTTKQHVLVDLISGIALAEICYYITGKIVYRKGKNQTI
ncbi:MAG: phosphatase PAP2 family protein [Lachnospiraceae bacterium]|nr:phosphatase PAP2 family protein [Lachnospiraceae bacterium]